MDVPKILNAAPLSMTKFVTRAPPNVRISANVVYKFTGVALFNA